MAIAPPYHTATSVQPRGISRVLWVGFRTARLLPRYFRYGTYLTYLPSGTTLDLEAREDDR